MALLAILVSAPLACGPPTGPANETTDPGRVGAWGAARVVEELRIGVSEGPEPYMFGRIQEIAAGLDGKIFVEDAQARVVRMFDEQGRFLSNVGRSGQGPGEYSLIAGMKVLPDGRLAIRDAGNARITFFSGAGTYLGEMPVERGVWGSNSLEFDLAGNLYVQAAQNLNAPENEWRGALRKYAPSGERSRTFRCRRPLSRRRVGASSCRPRRGA